MVINVQEEIQSEDKCEHERDEMPNFKGIREGECAVEGDILVGRLVLYVQMRKEENK